MERSDVGEHEGGEESTSADYLIGKLTRLWRLERGFPFKQQRRTSCTGEVVFSILGFDRPLKSMYE